MKALHLLLLTVLLATLSGCRLEEPTPGSFWAPPKASPPRQARPSSSDTVAPKMATRHVWNYDQRDYVGFYPYGCTEYGYCWTTSGAKGGGKGGSSKPHHSGKMVGRK